MAKRELEQFNIDIFKLKSGNYDYQFEIGDAFFDAFEESLVEKGSGIVKVSLEKTETFIKLNFNIDISVELECDRSLDLFDYAISTIKELILKFGDEDEEISEEIMIISRDKQRINLAQFIYEFIMVSIPMKKLHPRFNEEDDSDALIYSSEDESEDTPDSSSDEDDIDPRWQKLKNLK
ncbi:YceD family protein [Fulvivirga ligni]|uniref:YceD family protein n=1 Tax=Fulvivirga ligni TaxID=2904246 RepID=UPI001F452508|nr:DUF177 domain-containing protein [Fulvivirga ligni]UII21091.1 DUF177 domain-containing protein [Fulvivirga ligni]